MSFKTIIPNFFHVVFKSQLIITLASLTTSVSYQLISHDKLTSVHTTYFTQLTI